MVKGLSVGRIVHYVLSHSDVANQLSVGKHRPAIVVETFEGANGLSSLINLIVFLDGANDNPMTTGLHTVWVTSREYDEAAVLGTWHWPERVD